MKNTEALRCLLCKKPKCSIQGCPVHTSVPECMQLYREDRLDEAGEILFDNNPLSAITSLVCDWRQPAFTPDLSISSFIAARACASSSARFSSASGFS